MNLFNDKSILLKKEPSMSLPEIVNVLVVDDIKQILDVITEKNCDYSKINYSIHHFDPTHFYNENINNRQKLNECSRTLMRCLCKDINKVRPDYICFDRGYSVKEVVNDIMYSVNYYKSLKVKINADDLFYEGSEVVECMNSIANLKGILIYTFDPFDLSVYGELSEIKNHISNILRKDIEVNYIETSAYYNKPKNHMLYKGWYDNKVINGVREIGTVEQIKEYGGLVYDIIRDYIERMIGDTATNNIKSYNNKENLSFIKYKRIIADKFNEVIYDCVSKAKFKLGALSYYDEDRDLLIDIPYKPYYPALDKLFDQKDIFGKLSAANNRNIYKEGLNYIYYKIYLEESGDCQKYKILISEYYSVVGGEVTELNYTIIVNILSIAFSSIYYVDYAKGNNDGEWIDPEKSLDISDITYIQLKEKILSQEKIVTDPIYLIFFYNNVDIKGVTGSINYTFYSDELNYGVLKEESIRSIATYIYNNFRLLLEVRARDSVFPKMIEKQKVLSLKAAISQVMARNMSHNIGSHVLSRFMHQSDIQSVDGTQTQYKYTANNLNYENIDDGGDTPEDKKNKLVALFNMYLKNRMDFLADIATSDPSIEYPMVFADDIIDLLYQNEILLSRISGINDNVKYSIVLKGDKSAIVSVANGVLGVQALYVIIENIIRNTYKHGRPKNDIIFTVELIRDVVNDYYRLDIYDDNFKDKETIDEVVFQRNKTLCKDVLIKNVLRSDSLGSIEMMVCAAYLRCLPLISIKNNGIISGSNQLIKAIRKEIGENYSIGYSIYMNTPKNVLVIGKTNTEIFNGIDGVNVVDQINPNEVYNYQFLYDPENKVNNLNNNLLPKRVVKSKNIIQEMGSDNNLENIMSLLWKEYIKNILADKDLNYTIVKGKDISGRDIEIVKSFRNEILNEDIVEAPIVKIYIDHHSYNYTILKECCNTYYDMARFHTLILREIKYFECDDEKAKIVAICKYIESVVTSIMIIDERIQDSVLDRQIYYEDSGNKVIWSEYFEKQSVYIPKVSDVNLNKADFIDGGKDSVKSKLINYIKNNKVDFYLVHLGVLEKMAENGSSVSTVMYEIFSGIPISKIVIMSGRGTANNLPDGVAFLPISLVQDSIEVKHDKFLLSNILYNSRTKYREMKCQD